MTANPVRAYAIRAATADDIATILRFIRALAEFERLSHQVAADAAALTRNLFGPRAYAECLIAEADGVAAGFALYFHNFSTFAGKPGLYLEDIYVEPAFRGRGIGRAFFRELATIALARDCGRLEWSVLDWNENAIRFYRGMGAEPLSDWTVMRLTPVEMERLAKG